MPTKGMKPLRRALGVVEDHLRTYDIDVLDNTYFLIAHGRERGNWSSRAPIDTVRATMTSGFVTMSSASQSSRSESRGVPAVRCCSRS